SSPRRDVVGRALRADARIGRVGPPRRRRDRETGSSVRPRPRARLDPRGRPRRRGATRLRPRRTLARGGPLRRPPRRRQDLPRPRPPGGPRPSRHAGALRRPPRFGVEVPMSLRLLVLGAVALFASVAPAATADEPPSPSPATGAPPPPGAPRASADSSPRPAPVSQGAPAEWRVGDQLEVPVLGRADLSSSVRVLAHGTIDLPVAGRGPADG